LTELGCKQPLAPLLPYIRVCINIPRLAFASSLTIAHNGSWYG
jgi:hypothetical protein